MEAAHEVVVLDNLSNSSEESLRRVQKLTGREPIFINGDIRDRGCLNQLFAEHDIAAVINFAGLKAVANPLTYYDCNVVGTLRLLEAMQQAGVRQLVFSSSATVYGDPASVPIREDFPLITTNPYGASKLHTENMLRDLQVSDAQWAITLLRYFNPVGAHESGLIGGDYPTADGTGVRDYIHVMDLAEGHLAALKALPESEGVVTVNLGTGLGYSMLEMIEAFSTASGRPVPYEIASRRPRDVALCYADPSHAEATLGWKARRGVDEMCRDHWRWQMENPEGYQGS